MRSKLLVASLCVLALAGCQTMGGGPEQVPGTPPGNPSSGAQPAPPPPSPWDIARENGMAFRATGNEPGWSVEVQKSHSPTMFVALDYNQRQLKVPNAVVAADPAKGTVTFSGDAGDGTPVQLTVTRGQCQDNMSGQKFAASAELDIGAKQYKGCGRFLLH